MTEAVVFDLDDTLLHNDRTISDTTVRVLRTLALKGIRIIPEQFPIGVLTLPVGGFIVLACLIAAMQWALARPKKEKEESKS